MALDAWRILQICAYTDMQICSLEVSPRVRKTRRKRKCFSQVLEEKTAPWKPEQKVSSVHAQGCHCQVSRKQHSMAKSADCATNNHLPTPPNYNSETWWPQQVHQVGNTFAYVFLQIMQSSRSDSSNYFRGGKEAFYLLFTFGSQPTLNDEKYLKMKNTSFTPLPPRPE